MRDTPSNSLSAADICVILESCFKNKVKTLHLQKLKVTFFETALPASTEGFVNNPDVEAATGQATEFSQSPESAEFIEEFRMAQLMTDDPVAYEQLMIDANLNAKAVDNATEVYRGFESDL